MDGNSFNNLIEIKKIIVAHKFTYNENSVYTCNEGRKSYGLVYVINGELNYRFSNGKNFVAKENDLFLLKPNDSYTVTSPGICDHFTVNFLINEIPTNVGFIDDMFFLPDLTVVHQSFPKNILSDCINELCVCWQEKREWYELYCHSLLYKLIYEFIKTQTPYLNDKKYLKIKKAKEYIDANWNLDFSLKDLADACYMSVPHFRHLFKEVFSVSCTDYRNNIRLNHAKDYIAQGYFSISEIALMCGFEDANYFSRFFKKHTGISPKKFYDSNRF